MFEDFSDRYVWLSHVNDSMYLNVKEIKSDEPDGFALSLIEQ